MENNKKEVKIENSNLPISNVMGSCFKFLDDDTEIIIIANNKLDADKQIKLLNAQHHNGYKYLGELTYYNCL
jgi:hypothetical protein